MDYREQVLFPTAGRSHYRIPSVVVTNDGTLLAFCNDRKDTVDDHAAETAIAFARKPLHGAWEPIRALAALWSGLSPEEMKNRPWASNASVTAAECENGVFRLLEYGRNDFQEALTAALPKTV